MDRNTTNLLLSEWNAVHNYLERLFHALLHHPAGPLSKEELQALESYHTKLAQAFAKGLFNKQHHTGLPPFHTLVCLQENTRFIRQILEGLIRWKTHEDDFIEFFVELVNLLYDTAYELHWIVAQGSELEIQYPRTGLVVMNSLGRETQVIALSDRRRPAQRAEVLETNEDTEEMTPPPPRRFGPQGLYAIDGELGKSQSDENTTVEMKTVIEEEAPLGDEFELIAHFSLPLEEILRARELGLNIVEVVDHQRARRYEQMIQEGHEAVFCKEHNRALECFMRALNYRETAEVLTLVGWSYSLLGQLDKAKSYCLRAIQKDPDYGPPYNDMGSYLLAEGQTEESLKWFELAKRAINYQNREYPYINAGRAYMTKKKLDRALEEFSQALTLAPFHEELHKTVEKLKKSLMKTPQTGDNLPSPSPL
jgi:hypothetical protein